MVSEVALILGDQLSMGISALRAAQKERAVVLMAEVRAETDYTRHHKQKIAFFLSAMRHFARELDHAGWCVRYVPLDCPENRQSIVGEIERAVEDTGAGRVIATQPGEWRLRQELADVRGIKILPDDRFIASEEEFSAWARGRRQLRMEYFYREMRRKTGLLMDGDQPEGGQWNYDAQNREPLRDDVTPCAPFVCKPDSTTRTVIQMVERVFPDNFGTTDGFGFAVTRADALKAARHFIRHALALFGDYQDAMAAGEHTLFHSVLSPYLNTGLLSPMEVCEMAETAYRSGDAPLNAVEGFIRQIIGWREFIRGIYFHAGPDYTSSNFFGNTRALPEFYWTADTDLACVRDAVEGTQETAYAHHIQRLMVTGNFALLAGVDPAQVHDWYLAVYADALEWVEAPNTIGMSQFADGGLVGSKPYAASGAYINRMSNYCAGCAYNVKERETDKACPFNALYWDFIVRNEGRLGKNPRLQPVYRNWARMKDVARTATLKRADALLARMDAGERI